MGIKKDSAVCDNCKYKIRSTRNLTKKSQSVKAKKINPVVDLALMILVISMISFQIFLIIVLVISIVEININNTLIASLLSIFNITVCDKIITWRIGLN